MNQKQERDEMAKLELARLRRKLRQIRNFTDALDNLGEQTVKAEKIVSELNLILKRKPLPLCVAHRRLARNSSHCAGVSWRTGLGSLLSRTRIWPGLAEPTSTQLGSLTVCWLWLDFLNFLKATSAQFPLAKLWLDFL